MKLTRKRKKIEKTTDKAEETFLKFFARDEFSADDYIKMLMDIYIKYPESSLVKHLVDEGIHLSCANTQYEVKYERLKDGAIIITPIGLCEILDAKNLERRLREYEEMDLDYVREAIFVEVYLLGAFSFLEKLEPTVRPKNVKHEALIEDTLLFLNILVEIGNKKLLV